MGASQVIARSATGLDFGVILMPEGLLGFIREMVILFHEINLVGTLPADPRLSSCYHVISLS